MNSGSFIIHFENSEQTTFAFKYKRQYQRLNESLVLYFKSYLKRNVQRQYFTSSFNRSCLSKPSRIIEEEKPGPHSSLPLICP